MVCTAIAPLEGRIRLRINTLDHTETSVEDLGMIFLSPQSRLRLSSYRDGSRDYAYLNRASAETGG